MNAGNRKSGFLNKRSEGRLRNVWQRRKCEVREGFLNIYHADESKQPTKVNLLTCQMKPVADDRLCFDVVSYNRTYHFQVSKEADCGNTPNMVYKGHREISIMLYMSLQKVTCTFLLTQPHKGVPYKIYWV